MENIFKRFELFFCGIVCLISASLYAQIPEHYYFKVENKMGKEAILTALHEIISSHTDVGYKGLYEVYKKSDKKTDNNIWDMYSDCNFVFDNQCGNYSNVCDCYNREHSVPQSWFNEKSPMKSDAFHVYPTDGKVNGQRSNYPYGECEEGKVLSDKARGRLGNSTFEGYNGKVFEPDDEYKGDFARTYFYMVACYRYTNFTNGNGHIVFSYNDGKTDLTPYSVKLFLKWHREDPVSEKEKIRNDAVYSFQKNRNPFIDYPCLAEYIWGDYQDKEVLLSDLISPYDPKYNNSDFTGCHDFSSGAYLYMPNKDTVWQIGKANLNESVSHIFLIRGVNITEKVRLEIKGEDSTFFSLSDTILTPNIVNGGAEISITYTPTSIGSHKAVFTISSPEINKHTVCLTGQCLSEISLSTAQNTMVLYANYVGDTVMQNLWLKGTNLSDSVRLSLLESEYSPYFSISPMNLSAEKIMQGTFIKIQYVPKRVGKQSVLLKISSVAENFTDTLVQINGICDFDIEELTIIDTSSIKMKWNDAGVNSYIVDAYKIMQLGEMDDTLLIDNCTDTEKISSSSGYINAESSGIRLGSSKQLGTINYSVSIPQNAIIKITLLPYNDDADVHVVIKMGEEYTIDTLISSETNEYSFVATADYSSLSIATATTKKRVYVQKVIIEKKGKGEEKEHLKNYPQVIENSLEHTISKLKQNQIYYVSVTPVGYDSFIVVKDIIIENENNQHLSVLFAPNPKIPIEINADSLYRKTRQNLLVKGKNFHNNVQLTVRPDNFSKYFSLSDTVLTAEEVNDGIGISMYYEPPTIGTYAVILSIIESNSEMDTINFEVRGKYDFDIYLSQLDSQTVMVNWKNAGVDSFIIDVSEQSLTDDKESLYGFPKIVANTLDYVISDLLLKQIYYITVTPIGYEQYSVEKSIELKRDTLSPPTNLLPINIDKNGNTLLLYNLTKGMVVSIYDSAGKVVKKQKITNEALYQKNHFFTTLQHGVYLIVVNDNKQTKTYKIIM